MYFHHRHPPQTLPSFPRVEHPEIDVLTEPIPNHRSVPPTLFIQMTSRLFITTILGGRGGGGYHVQVSEKYVDIEMFDYI